MYDFIHNNNFQTLTLKCVFKKMGAYIPRKDFKINKTFISTNFKTSGYKGNFDIS